MDIRTEDKRDHENGFYCEVCDCIVKDSLSKLDHENGKRHLQKLGVSLKKFTDSTLEEVKEMLDRKRKEKEATLAGYVEDEDDEDEDERRRRLAREKKKRQKARKRGEID